MLGLIYQQYVGSTSVSFTMRVFQLQAHSKERHLQVVYYMHTKVEKMHFWFWLSFLLGHCYNYMVSLTKIMIYRAASERTISISAIYYLKKHLKLHLSARQFYNEFVLLYMHASHAKFRWGHMRWCAKSILG